ncbi:MAG: phenylalanine--tRNA ligase beta subunit-related protein [Myxococcota bacterium]|nr:phenylalanine--tRNA ligase beta subunit-related protein [Myxococcota bacterium]
MGVTLDEHPLLEADVFELHWPQTLEQYSTPESILKLFGLDTEAPLVRSESVRAAVRDLLRVGGFKPTGRSKPASEYLVKASDGGFLSSINVVVDICNAVSLHSGLPISVVDSDRANGSFRIGLADPEATYVFNASGQQIDVGGLLCLHDSAGPCANAVKDSQRTKTHGGTTRTLVVVWGTSTFEGRAEAAGRWFRELAQVAGGTVSS